MIYLYLIIGLIILLSGGELLVSGAIKIANKFQISPIVIGLTIVSFGTSLPELLVSLRAALIESPGITIGNVIGSNIANLTLVLGATVILMPIVIEKKQHFKNWIFMFVISIAFYFVAYDGLIDRIEAILLFFSLIAFIFIVIKNSNKHIKEADIIDNKYGENSKMTPIIICIIGGGLGLYFGSELLVYSAVEITRAWGWTEAVIGATVIALGTSLPELTASCIAAYKNEASISIGNLIGSNIFNILAIIGITALVKPITVSSEIMSNEMYWLLGVSLLVAPILFLGSKISRTKGAILLLLYSLFIFQLVF
jgi:cation:H+ antiporter